MKPEYSAVWAEIVAYGQALGLDLMGCAPAAALGGSRERYERYCRLGYSCGFEESDLEKRCRPEASLPGAATVIAAAMAYPADQALPEAGQGLFCRASWGLDYHQVLTEILTKIGEFCRQRLGANYTVMVDTGSLSDREAAVCCGLGWIGRNSTLITERYGSFVYLGELLLDVPLAVAGPPPAADGCGACERCAAACPLGAIDWDNRMVDTRRCLAYKTLEKGFPEPEVAAAIAGNGYVYGCDRCQLVCPYNQRRAPARHAPWLVTPEARTPALPELLALSNKQFKGRYGHLSGSWRGKGVLQRNGLLILGARRDPALRPMFEAIAAGDIQDMVKQAALWALRQYGTKETES